MRTFKKSLKLLMTLAFLLSTVLSFAGAPTWVRVDYTNSTTFTGEIVINVYEDPDLPVDAGDYIGAFVNGECRMIAQIFDNAGTLYVSGVLHGGDIIDGPNDPELVEFRLWDADADVSYDLMGTTYSDPGNHIALYPVGKPNTINTLSSLTVTGVDFTPAFSSSTTAYTAKVDNLPSLASYIVTVTDPRSTYTIDQATDFNSDPITTITVTAEDGTTKVYTITFSPKACLAALPTVTNKTACAGGNYSITATTSGVANWYADAAKTTLLLEGNDTYTPAAAGTFYVANNDGCITETVPVTLTVNALPVVDITSGTSVCAGATLPITATVTSAVSHTSLWTGDVSPLAATNSDNTTFNTNTSGSYNLTLTVTDANTCVGTDAVTVTVNALPVVTIADVTSAVCVGGSNVTLTANATPTGGTGVWSGGSIDPTTGVFSPSVSGDIQFTYTYTVNGCSASDQTTVTVSAAPTYAISGGGNFCPGTTKPDVNISLYGTSPWTLTYSNGTTTSAPVNVSSSPYVITEAEVGTYTLVSISDNSGCAGTVTNNSVAVAQTSQPAMPDASNVTVCAGEQAILTATTGTNIKWYDNSNLTGTPVTGSTFNTGKTIAGTYNYWVTQTNGCESPARPVVLTINAAPAAPTGGTVAEVCDGSQIPTLSFNETGITWVSNQDGSGQIIVADTYTPATVVSGLNTFYGVKVVNGCKSATATATINVKAKPAAPTVVDASSCQGQPFSALTAVGTIIKWYSQGVEVGTGASYTPSAAGSYTATQTINGCEGTAATATYTVNALPVVAISAPATVCIDGTVTLTKTPATGGVLKVNGTTVTDFDPSQYSAGDQTITYTYNDGCENSATTIINVIETPAPVVASTSMLINGTIPAFVATATGTVTWFSEAQAQLGTGLTYTPSVNTAVANTFTYYASNTANGCTSDKVSFTLQVSDCSVSAPVVSETNVEVCPGDEFPTLIATGTTIKWYSDAAHQTVVSTGTSYKPTAAGTLYVTNDNGTCEGPHTVVTVSVTTLPTVTFNSIGAYTCVNASAIDLTSYASPAGGSFSGDGVNATNKTFTAANVIGSVATLTYTVQSGTCSASATTTTTIQAIPTASISGIPSPICAGSAAISLVNYGSPAGGTFTGENIISNTFTPGAAKDYSVTYTVSQNGCSGTASAVITVSPVPPTPTLPVMGNVCQYSDAIALSSSYSWYTDQALLNPATNPYPTTTPGTVTLFATASNGTCKSAPATASFTIIAAPLPIESKDFYYLSTETSQKMSVTGTNIKWYDADKNLIAQGTDYTPTPALPLGTHVFYVTESNGTCTSDYSQMTLYVSNCTTPLPAVFNEEVCEGGSIPALTASGTNLKWYDSETSVVSIATGTTYQPTVTAVGVYTYYVSQTETCEGARKAVTLTINANPDVTISSTVSTVSVDGDPVSFSVSPQGGVFAGQGLTNNIFYPSSVAAGSYDITYTYVDVNGCTGTNKKTITVLPIGLLDYSALEAILVKAGQVLDTTVVGTAKGEYPQDKVNDLSYQILLGNSLLTNSQATQEDINAKVIDIQNAIDELIASVITKDPLDYTGIDALITETTTASDNAVAGNETGNYPQDAIDDLKDAIQTAKDEKNAATTQAQVDAAEDKLQAAFETFKGTKIIVATDIEITLAYVSLAVGSTYTIEYSPVPANANVIPTLTWTSNDTDIATVNSNGVITAVKKGSTQIVVSFNGQTKELDMIFVTVLPTGLSDVDGEEISIYPTLVNSSVTVKGADNVVALSIYTENGSLVKTIAPDADVLFIDMTDLTKGAYIVKAQTKGGNIVTKKLVKK